MRRVVAILASVELTLVLLVVFAIGIAVATFVEGSLGTAGSKALVYNARWFEGLLALLTLNLLLALGGRIPFRARQSGFVLVHIAMIVILIGAGMTRYFGHEGSLHIREGEQNDTMLSRDVHVQVTVDEESAAFPVRLYREGEQSWARRVSLGGGDYHLSVTKFWPHYAVPAHGSDDGGPSLDVMVKADEVSNVSIARGERRAVQGVQVAYREDTTLEGMGEQPRGRLEVRVGEARATLPVADALPAAIDLGGYGFTITEFRSDFKVGGTAEAVPRMSNPMVRVSVTSSTGESEERMLFAYFPEFARQHGQDQAVFAGVTTEYRCEPRVVFAQKGTAIVARSSLALVGEDGGAVAPGQEFVVSPRAIYRTPEDDLRVLLRASRGGGDESGAGPDPDAPPAAMLRLEDAAGESVEVVRVRGTGPVSRKLGEKDVSLAFGSTRVVLPYSLALDNFVLLTYPGSDKPSGYESHVRLIDPGRGIEGRPTVISMNSPLTHAGYKHFQSSYDQDRRGTILTVNYDPGKWPTYFGYTLITVGFLLALFKNASWRRDPERRVKGGGVA